MKVRIVYSNLGSPVIWRIPKGDALWIVVDRSASRAWATMVIESTISILSVTEGVEEVTEEEGAPGEEAPGERAPTRPAGVLLSLYSLIARPAIAY